jgi:hypothetical protein
MGGEPLVNKDSYSSQLSAILQPRFQDEPGGKFLAV